MRAWVALTAAALAASVVGCDSTADVNVGGDVTEAEAYAEASVAYHDSERSFKAGTRVGVSLSEKTGDVSVEADASK